MEPFKDRKPFWNYHKSLCDKTIPAITTPSCISGARNILNCLNMSASSIPQTLGHTSVLDTGLIRTGEAAGGGIVGLRTAALYSGGYQDNRMLLALLNIEPDKVFAMPDPNLPDDDYKMMATLSDLADRELVATIGWAKQVPGFINLPLSDQMNLLQSTWMDVLCLNLAYRSVPYKGLLVFADDFKRTEHEGSRFTAFAEVDTVARRLAKKMTDLKVTREEYILLKAMLLLNPDMDVDNVETVQNLRDRMQDSLLDYERSRGYSSHRRLGHLLFIFPMLMHKKLLAKEYWFSVKKNGRIPLHKLLSEMLEYACS